MAMEGTVPAKTPELPFCGSNPPAGNVSHLWQFSLGLSAIYFSKQTGGQRRAVLAP